MSHTLRVGCAVLCALCFHSIAFAQGTGTIHGAVYDESGAVVPGARVTSNNVATNQTRTVETNTRGLYVIPALPVGNYEVRIEHEGFAPFLQRNVLLQVNTTVQVNGTLQVGATTEQVTVSADATLTQTQSTTLVQVVDERRVTDLPLNGRNVLQLMTLNAGISDQNARGSTIQTNTLARDRYHVSTSINGSRGNATNFLLDNSPNNDIYTNISAPYPNPDAVQEFSIQTSSFDAQYGRGVGGIVNVVTRSGTNDFHGSLFHFIRNNKLNAGNLFSGRDSLKRNQFGGSAGGPLVRDRTFIFGSYQGTRERIATPGVPRTTPSEAMKRGDLSAFLLPDGTGRIKMPDTSGSYFPNNQIPVSMFDPVSAGLLSKIPSSSSANYQVRFGTPSNVIDEDQLVLRVDHALSDKQRLSGRYFVLGFDNPWSFIPDNVLYVVNGQHGRAQNATVTHSYTISPRILNEISVSFDRQSPVAETPDDLDTNFQSLGSRINLAASPTMDLGISGWSGVSFGLGFVSIGTSYSISDNFSIVAGKHNLRFGGTVRRNRMDKNSNFFSGGNAAFTGQLLSDPGKSNAGNAFGEFLLGTMNSWRQQSVWSERIQLQGPELYIQDDIRVTDKLTVNVGMRWDPRFDMAENEFGKRMTFLPQRPDFQSTRFPNAPKGLVFLGDPGFEKRVTDNDLNNFAPRIGFAYEILPRTVIRAAYGIFYDQQMMINNNRAAQGAPFIQQVVLENPGPLSNPFGSSTPLDPSPQFPSSDFVFSPGSTWSLPATDWVAGYMQNWNFVVERQLGSDVLLRGAYVGSKGTDLLHVADVNSARWAPNANASNLNARRPFADISALNLMTAAGWSNYHSVQLTAQKRYSQNFSVLLNYTVSKSIDITSSCQGDGACAGPNPFNWNDNKGVSDFDIPQRLVVSGIFDHPALRDRNKFARGVLGGWQSNLIFTVQSGTPFTVGSGRDNNFDGVGGDFAVLTGTDWRLPSGRSKAEKIADWFNTAAFTTSAVGTFGTGRRNQLRGPGRWDVNYSVFKNFNLTEQARLQFRGEFFNLFNHPNLGTPGTTVTSSTFGEITSASDPRIIQFGLKVVW